MRVLLVCIYLWLYITYGMLHLTTRFRKSHLLGKGKQHFSSLIGKKEHFHRWGGISEKYIIKSRTSRVFEANNMVKGVWYFFKDYNYSFKNPLYFLYGKSNVHAPYKNNLVYYSGDTPHILKNESDIDQEVYIGFVYK